MTTADLNAATISLTIDGEAVKARPGQTILEVCRAQGIYVPTLCYLERLEPIGSCRMCVVQVEGHDTPVAACTTPVAAGMKVTTTSPYLEELRRETLRMLLFQYPMNCSACSRDGDCELQNLIRRYDIGHQDLHAFTVRPEDTPLEEPYATPLLAYHPRRCILCGRCVRACEEIAVQMAIQIRRQGAQVRVAPAEMASGPLGECVSCGECMDVCPTLALVERGKHLHPKPWEVSKVKTVCGYCGCGCQLVLQVVGGQVIGVESTPGGVSDGALCAKGRFGYAFIHHPDRLKAPQIWRNGRWEEVGWDEALDFIAERLVQIRAQHGPDSIVGLSSARCTNEENYLFQKFFRGVIGTNNVDHCARL